MTRATPLVVGIVCHLRPLWAILFEGRFAGFWTFLMRLIDWMIDRTLVRRSLVGCKRLA